MDTKADYSDDILTEAVIQQLREKLRQAVGFGFAEVVLVVEKGRLRWIRGPAPSEPVRR